MQDQNHKGKDITLMIAAIGIVFGDIGTSPLYALRESFLLGSGSRIDASSVIGIVSLLIWTLTLIVCVKYLGIVLRADNKGEGGILALVSLISRYVPKSHAKRAGFIGVLGIVGAALLYSDGMLTPAVSVLSAIEGLTVITPNLSRFVVPIALVVLVALFPFQCRGTTKMGRVFGPVLSFWFVVIAYLGLHSIIQHPGILAALNPLEAISYIARNGRMSLEVMGSIFLAMTGAEVLYSDLGHFGRSPIRRSWFCLVYPALLLNYSSTIPARSKTSFIGSLPNGPFSRSSSSRPRRRSSRARRSLPAPSRSPARASSWACGRASRSSTPRTRRSARYTSPSSIGSS